MASCSLQKFKNEIFILGMIMDYDIALRLEKMKVKRSKQFHNKTSSILFIRTNFQRIYAKIIQNEFESC